jgi:topoisomerase-4 subunit A
LANDQDLVTLEIHRPDRQFLVASDDGRGFRVNSADVVAQTRSGRQVMNPARGAKATICVATDGDSIAIVGTNRKLLIFALEEIPELTRGKGVILQRYKDGKMADAKVFRAEDGISWHMNGGRQRTETDLTTWIGKRASAGKLPPTGFPRPPRFN